MTDTAPTTRVRGNFFKKAAQNLFQVLSQERHRLDDETLDEDALRLAMELSLEETVRQGYVWDQASDFGVDASTAAIMREEARLLRDEQDREFEQALAADRRKQLRQQRRERERQQKEQRLASLRQCIVAEPDSDQDSTAKASVSRLTLRFPDGTRAERRFRSTDKLSDVRNYAEARILEEQLKHSEQDAVTPDSDDDTLEEVEADSLYSSMIASGAANDAVLEQAQPTARISLSCGYPRRTLDDTDLTLADAGLCPGGVVFVEVRAQNKARSSLHDLPLFSVGYAM
jgi:hypothetical protein